MKTNALKKNSPYTEAQIAFIVNNLKEISTRELTTAFNAEFSTDKTLCAIRGAIKKRGLKSGLDTRFKKGMVPFNAGTKGLSKANSGTFTKNRRPDNSVPVGSELLTRDGYIMIKTADPNTWQLKHHAVYGPVPKGFVLRFKDQDTTNCDRDNLELVSMAENLRLNQAGYSTAPNEIKPLIKALAKIQCSLFDKIRNEHAA